MELMACPEVGKQFACESLVCGSKESKGANHVSRVPDTEESKRANHVSRVPESGWPVPRLESGGSDQLRVASGEGIVGVTGGQSSRRQGDNAPRPTLFSTALPFSTGEKSVLYKLVRAVVSCPNQRNSSFATRHSLFICTQALCAFVDFTFLAA